MFLILRSGLKPNLRQGPRGVNHFLVTYSFTRPTFPIIIDGLGHQEFEVTHSLGGPDE